jgi:hypothetical protein
MSSSALVVDAAGLAGSAPRVPLSMLSSTSVVDTVGPTDSAP